MCCVYVLFAGLMFVVCCVCVCCLLVVSLLIVGLGVYVFVGVLFDACRCVVRCL